MTNVALYCDQPILTAGLQAAVAGIEDLRLSAVFTDIDLLMKDIERSRPSVILLEMSAAVTLSTLSTLKSVAGHVPMVLWIDAAAMEFVSQALTLGVRGFLRRSLPLELQIKCLRAVAAGDLWVEQALCDQLLTAKRVSLTRREGQLINLLAQGLRNKEIAYAMTLSEGTVKVYLSRLFQKVGVNDRFDLALFALRNSFVDAAQAPGPATTGGKSVAPARSPTTFLLPGFVTTARPAVAVQ